MEFDESILAQIKQFGIFGYDVSRMAKLTGLDYSLLQNEMDYPESPVRKAYDSGQALCDLKLDKRAFKDLKNGDNHFAVKDFQDRQERRKYNDLKKELFNI